MKLRGFVTRHINAYRIAVAAGFIIAAALVLAIPVKMTGASPWQNFAQGDFTVDDTIHSEQVEDAKQQGGMLQQYFEIDDNKWALEKAPGYVFYIIPFQLLGIPRWGNVLLALGMTLMTFLLLKRIRDEKTACIGSLLMLFTPVSLIMMNNTYMDTFASLAFLAMGGGLYIYYHLGKDKVSPVKGGVMLFLAFLLISWSVVTRYTNFPIAAIFALHFVITLIISLRGKMLAIHGIGILSVVLGIGIPLAFLLFYDYFVFGAPLDYGYNYTHFPIKFAFEYLGQVDKSGQPLPLKIIMDNIAVAPVALLKGFPLLIIGIPGLIAVLYYKFKHGNSEGIWSSLNKELPWDILIILIGWFVSVFCLYLMYEFTAENLGDNSSFIRFARYYLPGLFPIVIICALIIARLPFKLYIPLLAIAIIAGTLIYTDYTIGSSGSHGDRNTPNRQQQDRTMPRQKAGDGFLFNESGYLVNIDCTLKS